MGRLSFEVPHSLTKDEAEKRVRALIQYWSDKYGVRSSWSGDQAELSGKVMGIQLEAKLRVESGRVGGEANDPGLLFRSQAKKYLTQKFEAYLDPAKSLADLNEA